MSDISARMEPLTPMGTKTPKVDVYGPVTLSEVVDCALASFSARLGQQDAARNALMRFCGNTLPGPGQAVLGTVSVFWTGPEQWMVMAPHDTHEDLAEQLKVLATEAASTTEQNDAWCRFDLEGPNLADIFERLCPINIRASSGGEATRTNIDHLGCFVIVGAPDAITVLGPRSSAGSLHHALVTAIRSAI